MWGIVLAMQWFSCAIHPVYAQFPEIAKDFKDEWATNQTYNRDSTAQQKENARRQAAIDLDVERYRRLYFDQGGYEKLRGIILQDEWCEDQMKDLRRVIAEHEKGRWWK